MKSNFLKIWVCTFFFVEGIVSAWGAGHVAFSPLRGAFCLAGHGRAATIHVDTADYKGVYLAALNLGTDIGKVTGTKADVSTALPMGQGTVIAGTLGRNRRIDEWVKQGKIDVSAIEGTWESFLVQTVEGNLVIAGSDKRGTIFGIYDLSEKIGVSPWHYFADVPVQRHEVLFVNPGRYVQGSPKVKYRGIFLNDEWPSLGGWASTKFGGFNSRFYAHVFELLLRLKANYMWPAMWASSFYEDDPANGQLADDMGIVMGTSHHEPMMRPHKDYTKRRKEVGPWDYATNKEGIDSFFVEGAERSRKYESIVTIGMRGDGDVAMGGGTDEENMAVLSDVIKGQREILGRVHGKDPAGIPQLWAVFTEVQRYYDKGFKVPDDVMLLFCDNNWGYIRRVGPWREQRRKGGMGLYYHIDMNGGPWNDRWINTTTIPKLREQFNLAYQSGIDDLWIVNVGDLKPKELPIDFIMRYAWNPDAIQADETDDYLRGWARQNFSGVHADAIAGIVSRYSQYNLWRKPEVQSTDIFSVVNHREADRVTELWRALVHDADSVGQLMPQAYKDAYYQLVLYPAKASAGVAEIYLAAAKNQLYARQGRVTANDYAQRVEDLYMADTAMTAYYNKVLAGGKWEKMMSDIHLGYTQYSMPKKDSVPQVVRVEPLSKPVMGVAVEGSEAASPEGDLELPVFDNFENRKYYIDIFNRGTRAFDFKVKTAEPWMDVSLRKGTVETETRLRVGIDWTKVKAGKTEGMLYICRGRERVPVKLRVVKAERPVQVEGHWFGNACGNEFSVPAWQFNACWPGRYAKWTFLPGLGRGKGCMGLTPVTAPSVEAFQDAPCLEYQVYFPNTGMQTVCLGILPTQDVAPERGLRLAFGLDDGSIHTLDARQGFVDTFGEYTSKNLKNSPNLKPLPSRNRTLKLINGTGKRRNEVFDNLRWLTAEFNVDEPGLHTFKVYMVDPEIVLEQLVFNPDNTHPSYFGAPPVRHQ